MLKEIRLNKYKRVSPENRKVGKMIYWGSDNLWAQYAYETVNNSTLLHSIIKGSIDFTLGDDFEDVTGIIGRLVADRWYFGGFCFQVLRNTMGRVVKLEYIDIRFCRLSVDKTKVYVLDPENPSRVLETLPVYDKNSRDAVSIYFYSGLTTREAYPVPEYSSSLVQAEIQAKIAEFHYNTLLNNFNVSAIINVCNGAYDEETRNKLERELNRKFSGTDNAAKLLVAFNDNAENKVTVERLNSDDFDSKYQAIQQNCMIEIFTSMGAMPQLFGLNYNTGFSEIDYETAYKFYYRTKIKPKQDEITNVMREFNVDIKFNAFTL